LEMLPKKISLRCAYVVTEPDIFIIGTTYTWWASRSLHRAFELVTTVEMIILAKPNGRTIIFAILGRFR